MRCEKWLNPPVFGEVERLNRTQEVVGSSPARPNPISAEFLRRLARAAFLLQPICNPNDCEGRPTAQGTRGNRGSAPVARFV